MEDDTAQALHSAKNRAGQCHWRGTNPLVEYPFSLCKMREAPSQQTFTRLWNMKEVVLQRALALHESFCKNARFIAAFAQQNKA